MMERIALCVDEESLKRPELLGLAGENLAALPWLKVFTSGVEARRALQASTRIQEVWVVSSDDVDEINLAAAIKRDYPERPVHLLSRQPSGSLRSRTHAAGIDSSMTHQAFVERYVNAKSLMTTWLGNDDAQAAAAFPQAAPPTRMASPSQAVPWSAASMQTATRNMASPSASAPTTRSAPADATAPFAPVKKVPQAAGRRAFILTVVSGSGGAGKSAVAALSAAISSFRGSSTLLLDADLQFGDLHRLYGASSALTVDDLVADRARIEELRSTDGSPVLLAAPRRLEQSEAIAPELGPLLDLLSTRFDVIVANTGANWAEQHAALLERSSKALFLVDQRASSLAACKHAVELCTRCGIATSPFLFAANRCTKRSLFSSIDVSCALQGAETVELRDGGPEVEDMLGAGMALDLACSRNDFCLSLGDVLEGVLGDVPASVAAAAMAAEKPRGLFSRRRGRRERGAW